MRRVNGTGLADLLRAVQMTSISLLVVGASAPPSDMDLALDTLSAPVQSFLLVAGRKPRGRTAPFNEA
jgi:hypothetical protein